MKDKLLIGADEAAALLSITRSALWARVRRGQIPHKRVGRRVFFHPEILAGWAQDGHRWPADRK